MLELFLKNRLASTLKVHFRRKWYLQWWMEVCSNLAWSISFHLIHYPLLMYLLFFSSLFCTCIHTLAQTYTQNRGKHPYAQKREHTNAQTQHTISNTWTLSLQRYDLTVHFPMAITADDRPTSTSPPEQSTVLTPSSKVSKLFRFENERAICGAVREKRLVATR